MENENTATAETYTELSRAFDSAALAMRRAVYGGMGDESLEHALSNIAPPSKDKALIDYLNDVARALAPSNWRI